MIRFIRISPRRWLYWGHETLDPSWESCDVVEPFWFLEEGEPYRVGNGWRVKESPTLAFHIGLAKSRPHVADPLEAIGGKKLSDYSPEDIGQWNGSVQEDAI